MFRFTVKLLLLVKIVPVLLDDVNQELFMVCSKRVCNNIECNMKVVCSFFFLISAKSFIGFKEDFFSEIYNVTVMRSHAHFHWSLVIDRLNPQKADRSSPHQDLIGPIENTVVISCPIIFMMPRTGLLLFPTKFQT